MLLLLALSRLGWFYVRAKQELELWHLEHLVKGVLLGIFGLWLAIDIISGHLSTTILEGLGGLLRGGGLALGMLVTRVLAQRVLRQ